MLLKQAKQKKVNTYAAETGTTINKQSMVEEEEEERIKATMEVQVH